MLRGAAKYIFIFTIIFSWSPIKAQVDAQDSLALIDLFSATSGGDWLIPWDTTRKVNEWFGVILTEDNSKVEGITLPNNQLVGQLPTTLSNLDKLTSLDLSDNLIEGKIPEELGGLDNLIFLDLSRNFLVDTIPNEIGLLSFLKTLDLSDNTLSGNIPGTFGDLDSLRILNLAQNQFSGDIPASMANLDSLNTLNISTNSITGQVPGFLQDLKVLREIDLSSNEIDGPLPTFWNQFNELRTLRLNNNKIEGLIPPEIGALAVLFTLDFSNNLLEGAIPQEIGNLDSLRVLDLSGNLLDLIPTSITNLPKLEVLDFSENSFVGPLPSVIGISKELRILDLHANFFTGIIPSPYGSILTLEELDLSQNNLLNTIPDSFLNLLLLEKLDISGNQFTALVDISELGISGSLQQFKVGDNSLGFDDLEINIGLFSDSTEYVPQQRINDTLNIAVPTGNAYLLSVDASGSANSYRWVFESMDSLVQISYDTANYQFSIEDFQEENSGSYSCEVISTLVPGLIIRRNPINLFPAINTIDSLALIQFNKATGGENWTNKWDIISEPVFTWEGVEIESGGIVGLDLENNNLEGYLTDSIGQLENLRVLDLSGNNIDGSLPETLGDLKELTILDLANNRFEGSIPDVISGLNRLTIIDLSRNRLDSTLTNQFDSLQLLTDLILSDNDITGTIPINLTSLSSLRVLEIGDNRITGEIPVELGDLEKLLVLDISENRLTGQIPEEIGLLPELEELKLFRNQLTGELPESFINSLTIERLFVNDNLLTRLPKFNANQFSFLELRVFNNILTFEDLVDNFNGFNNADREDEFLFLPQPTIIDNGTQALEKDQSITLEIPDNHPDSRYQWLREGAILGIDSAKLLIDSAQVISSGIYLGQVWTSNSNFRDEINTDTDSLVFSFSFTVLVQPPPPVVDEPDPFCVGNETITLINDLSGQSGLITRWYDTHPSLGGSPFSEDPLIIHQIQKESDTLFITNGLAINKAFQSEVDTVVIISRPWIVDKGDLLEVAPSDSILNTRFANDGFTSSYQWFTNDLLISGETGPTIQKSIDSRYHVRVIRGKCSSTSKEYDPPNSNLVLGVEDDLESQIIAYPNPVNNLLTVEGLDSFDGPINVSIIDLRGMTVYNLKMDTQNEKLHLSIDVSSFITGVYMIKAHSKESQVMIRFVKN